MYRNPRCLGIALALVLGMLLCDVSSVLAKDNGPIKIGFMVPYVGVFAKSGKDMDNGFRLGLEEAGYKAGGRQIVLIPEDTEAKPELAVTKARKLLDDEKVAMIAGFDLSGPAAACRDILVNHKIPMIITNAGQVDLTGKLKSPYIFRTSFTNGQHDLVGGWYAYNKMGFKRVVVLAMDLLAGHEKADAFMKTYKAAGGQVVDQIYPPPGTADFGPYLSKIAAERKAIDGVWMFFSGSGSIRLVNQYQEFGLKGSIPLFIIGDTVDDSVLPSMKESAAGIKNYLHYADTLNTPENQKFVEAYLAKYKEYPSMYAEQAYIGAKAIVMALNAVKGNAENTEAFMAALRKVKFDAPQGPFRFDANQNAVIPVYIREVRKVNGRYANVVLETIPDVDQDWTPAKMKK